MVTAENKAHFPIQVAVERLPVSAGELVEKKEQREISHFSAGECTERGRQVKALRCAPTADAARTQHAALTNLRLRSCVASSPVPQVRARPLGANLGAGVWATTFVT